MLLQRSSVQTQFFTHITLHVTFGAAQHGSDASAIFYERLGSYLDVILWMPAFYMKFIHLGGGKEFRTDFAFEPDLGDFLSVHFIGVAVQVVLASEGGAAEVAEQFVALEHV